MKCSDAAGLRSMVSQGWIEQADGVAMTSQMPRRACSDGSCTDDSNVKTQLKASLGITSA